MPYIANINGIIAYSGAVFPDSHLVSSLPDSTFDNRSWVELNGAVVVDPELAKLQVHEMRRRLREELFQPYDSIIAKQIPGQSFVAAEAERIKIRMRDSDIQQSIEDSVSESELKDLIAANGLA